MTDNVVCGQKYAVIVLAGGLSSRSGADNHKLLATKGALTLLEHCLQTIPKASNASIVVTGANRERIRMLLPSDCREAYNSHYADGMASSLKTGIKALPETCDMAFICLADMPFVRQETFLRLLDAAKEHPEKSIFIPSCKGQSGNPVLWRQDMFPHLRSLKGDTGGKQLFSRFPEKCIQLDVSDTGILRDIDTHSALKEYGFTV